MHQLVNKRLSWKQDIKKERSGLCHRRQDKKKKQLMALEKILKKIFLLLSRIIPSELTYRAKITRGFNMIPWKRKESNPLRITEKFPGFINFLLKCNVGLLLFLFKGSLRVKIHVKIRENLYSKQCKSRVIKT